MAEKLEQPGSFYPPGCPRRPSDAVVRFTNPSMSSTETRIIKTKTAKVAISAFQNQDRIPDQRDKNDKHKNDNSGEGNQNCPDLY